MRTLSAGEVHVARFAYASATAHDVLDARGWLPSSDLVAADRFVLPELRDRAVLRKAFLRQTLAEYTHVPAREIAIASGRRGKPSIEGFSISLTHTDDLVLVAIAPAPLGVGVDVERVAAALDPIELARIVLAPDEARAVAAAPDEDARKRSFLRIWCRKESCLKVTGIGLLDDLTSLSVALDAVDLAACRDPRVAEGDRVAVYVRDLDVGPDHVAALATSIEAPRVTLRAFAS